MKSIFWASVIIILLTGTAYSAESVQCKKIVISGNAEYPPLTWQDKSNPKKLIGFAVELLEIAFSDTEIEVDARYVGPWARAQNEVKQGNIDMLGGAYITEERQTYMDYIIPPFVMDPTVIFVKKGKPFHFEKWEDLIGLTGGTPLGNSYGEKFDSFAKKNLKIELVPKINQAFKKLARERNDYVIYGMYPGLAEAEATGFSDKIEHLSNSIISEGLYFTISKKSPCNSRDIKDHLSRKVKEFSEKKIPDKLIKKYLQIWREQSKPVSQ